MLFGYLQQVDLLYSSGFHLPAGDNLSKKLYPLSEATFQVRGTPA